jgi:hypothetical protein
MPERRQNLARMNRARLHTLSPELTAARKKKFFFPACQKVFLTRCGSFSSFLKLEKLVD